MRDNGPSSLVYCEVACETQRIPFSDTWAAAWGGFGFVRANPCKCLRSGELDAIRFGFVFANLCRCGRPWAIPPWLCSRGFDRSVGFVARSPSFAGNHWLYLCIFAPPLVGLCEV